MRTSAQEPTDDLGVLVGADGLARPRWAATDPLLRQYYDTEWGMPVRDEQRRLRTDHAGSVPGRPVLGHDPA